MIMLSHKWLCEDSMRKVIENTHQCLWHIDLNLPTLVSGWMYFQNLASLPLSHRVIEIFFFFFKSQNGHSVKISKCWKGQSSIACLYNHRFLNALTFQSLILKEKIIIRVLNGHTLILSHDNSCSFSGKCTNITSADTEFQFWCHTVLLVLTTNGYPREKQ